MTRGATLAPIVAALGGDLSADGRQANVPGPGHGRKDRSVSLLLSEGRVVVHSFAGDDWRDVLDTLRARGLIDAQARLRGVPVSGDGPPRPSAVARIAAARSLWDEARPLGVTLSARHLASRGVAAPAEDALRHHPAAPAAVYARQGVHRPALLAAIRDLGGALVGVELTYLAASGARARLATPHKTIGTCPAGAAVRLWPAGARMVVGEGIFTSLSAAQRFGMPAWALLSTRNLRRWRAPAGVAFVLIAADRGRDGEDAARTLAARLRGDGLRGVIRWPPAPFGDWNEAESGARAVEEGEEGPDRTGAADGRSGPPAWRSDP